jgi:imidazolonepropionase-like amidohydrolase
VRGEQIAAIGPAEDVPPDATRIEGQGRFLLPGLVDMHVHLFESGDLLLYLSHGVTTIRNLGGYGSADSILRIRREVAAGTRLGPTIFTSGNWLDGDPPYRAVNTVLRTPAEARAEVEREHELGYDFVKVYATLRPEVYAEILRTGREVGIPVTGHVPGPVGVAAVLAGGQVAVDHAAQLADGDPGGMAGRVRSAGVSVTTTLVMLEIANLLSGTPARLDSLLALPETRYLSPATLRFWREAPFFGQSPGALAGVWQQTQRLVRALNLAGVPVMAGTDTGLWGNIPGRSLLDELELLVASGMTPVEALRAATWVPGQFLDRVVPGADQPVALAPGSRADLLLVEGDPLADITNLRRQAGVMVRGQWLSAADLQEKLERLAAGYAAGRPVGPPTTASAAVRMPLSSGSEPVGR